MWLLTTRNRPDLCRRMLLACIETGVETPGLVWMDGCSYDDMPLPKGWKSVTSPRHRNIGWALRSFLSVYPDLPWYGWLADDIVPKTPGWDLALVEAAGSKCIAYPNDEWQRGTKQRDGSPHVTSAVCLGGDLVRAMGLLALPDQVQMYIDDVWESVAVPLGLMRYLPDVVVEHHHFANGLRLADATDARTFEGKPFPMRDAALYHAWLTSPKYRKAMRRVARLP